MTPCKFVFDDSPEFEGFSHESRWNGFDNVAVTARERERIAAWMERSTADDEVNDLMAIEAIPGTEPALYSLGWGYATQIVRPGLNFAEGPQETELPDDAAALIAARFVQVLHAWLEPDEWRLMGERNAAETGTGICHSHDFCDANMAMCEAFESVTGKTPDGANEAEARLWGTAWANAMPYLTLYTAEWKEH